MSASRNPDLLIKAFLAEGIDELPDRSFDAVRTAIDETRQWAVIGPWKESQIMTTTRFALIAAAIAVIAVVAIRFLPSSTVGPAPTPSPTIGPTPSPIVAASPLSLTVTGNGPVTMAAGTYSVGLPFPVPLQFTVPADWTGNIGGVNAVFLQKATGTNNISFTLNQSLYADACHFSAGLMTPAPGPSAADLAAALASIRGLTATVPTDVTMDGYSGKQLSVTSPFSIAGCDLPPDSTATMRLWKLPLGATEDIGLGWTDRFIILDVAGQRLVIQSSGPQDESASNRDDVTSIIDSLVINP